MIIIDKIYKEVFKTFAINREYLIYILYSYRKIINQE